MHAFIECKRAQDAWGRLEPTWQAITGKPFDYSGNIFGEIELKDKYLSWLANVMVQLMQRTIWQTRKVFEEKDTQKDVWSYFKWKLSLILNRTYLFWGRLL